MDAPDKRIGKLAELRTLLQLRQPSLEQLIGYGAYSMSIKAEPEPPCQGFCILDSKRGKCHAKDLWVMK